MKARKKAKPVATNNVRGIVAALFCAGCVAPRNRVEVDLSPIGLEQREWQPGDGLYESPPEPR